MWNEAFLKSFSVRAEELDKNSDSIRPLDREFNEVSRKNEIRNAGHYSASFGDIPYACSWKISSVCYCYYMRYKSDQTFPAVTFGWLVIL